MTLQGGDITVDCMNKTYDHVPHLLNPRLVRLKLINQRIRTLSNIDVYTKYVTDAATTNNYVSTVGLTIKYLYISQYAKFSLNSFRVFQHAVPGLDSELLDGAWGAPEQVAQSERRHCSGK